MAAWSLLTGLGILPPRLYDFELPLQDHLLQKLPYHFILGEDISVLQVRHGMALIWVYGFFALSTLSTLRTVRYILQDNRLPPRRRHLLLASAISKLASPCIVSACALAFDDSAVPSDLGGIRYPSLCVGLVFCIMTIKVIVFGMARMAYASVQLDIVPLVAMVLLHDFWRQQQQLVFVDLLFPLASIAYLIRLVWWTRLAIDQLCRRLNVDLFRIQTKCKKG